MHTSVTIITLIYFSSITANVALIQPCHHANLYSIMLCCMSDMGLKRTSGCLGYLSPHDQWTNDVTEWCNSMSHWTKKQETLQTCGAMYNRHWRVLSPSGWRRRRRRRWWWWWCDHDMMMCVKLRGVYTMIHVRRTCAPHMYAVHVRWMMYAVHLYDVHVRRTCIIV